MANPEKMIFLSWCHPKTGQNPWKILIITWPRWKSSTNWDKITKSPFEFLRVSLCYMTGVIRTILQFLSTIMTFFLIVFLVFITFLSFFSLFAQQFGAHHRNKTIKIIWKKQKKKMVVEKNRKKQQLKKHVSYIFVLN